jgi:serine/threonine protein kinase
MCMETNHCPVCQSPIPENAPGGFCQACLLRDAEEAARPGDAAPSLAVIATAFPRLEVMELIGQGGMGFVYKVRQPDLDRTVALKILAPELGRDPAFAERFSREARTLGKLHHPNIVTIFEHGESGGYFYLLMEYVDGVNLRQAMRAGRFSPEQALAIVPAICDALQYAHERGVWHRDIKPENILLDRDGKVKIADFGIARIIGDPHRDFTLTMTGNALGSTAYMAPEQHEKPHDVDHRADIYSLGVVIYEMLTGELPLGRFPAPSQRAAVNARIDEIVFRTLEKERELRQQSATEVKTELEGAAKSAAPTKPARDLQRDFPSFAWSVGLWLGGIAAVIAGLFTAPTVTGLGLVAAVIGFVGCGWLLWKIRRGDYPNDHRLALLILAFWPMVTGLSLAAAMLWGGTMNERYVLQNPNAGVTKALFGYSVLGFIAPLVAGILLWKFFGVDPSRSRRSPCLGDWLRAICVAGLLLGGMVLLKSVKQQDIASETHRVGVMQIYDSEEPRLEMIHEAVAHAVGENQHNSRFHVYGPKEDISPWEFRRSDSPYVVVEWTSRDRSLSESHWRLIENRLRATLPKRVEINSQNVGGYWDRVSVEAREDYRRARTFKVLIMILAPVLAVSLALACASPLPWLLPVVALVLAAGIDRSPWPAAPTGLPPSIDSWAPLEPLPMPEYDFSTTRDAMESMIKAAKKGDVEAFKRGISSKLLQQTMAETSDWSEPIRDFAKLRYGYQTNQEGNVATVLMNGTTPKQSLMNLVREDGDWKLAAPERNVAPESPRAAMEDILRAARERDTQALRKRLSRSLLVILNDNDKLYKTCEQFAACRVAGDRLLDESNAEVTLESDDNPLKSTFRMVMEDGIWKLTEHVSQHR